MLHEKKILQKKNEKNWNVSNQYTIFNGQQILQEIGQLKELSILLYKIMLVD